MPGVPIYLPTRPYPAKRPAGWTQTELGDRLVASQPFVGRRFGARARCPPDKMALGACPAGVSLAADYVATAGRLKPVDSAVIDKGRLI